MSEPSLSTPAPMQAATLPNAASSANTSSPSGETSGVTGTTSPTTQQTVTPTGGAPHIDPIAPGGGPGGDTAGAGTDDTTSDGKGDSGVDMSTVTQPVGAELLSTLDGYLYRGECDGGSASFECPLRGCSNGVLQVSEMFTLGGNEDAVYDVSIHVYGVVELRHDYQGGARRQGGASNQESKQDFWYEGGSYTPGAGYNVYGLRVTPAVEGVAAADGDGNNYFLNARDGSNEGHEVWVLDYEAKLRALGGGSIEFTAYDPNCLQIMNNQETARPMAGTGTDGALVVDLSAASPSPSDFEQPLSTAGRQGQWVYIDVLDVVEVQL
ncbi:MAG TPA: hypothetical protein VHM70_11655 [Polyangiaceae bacterium]|nr:hypothetical protein [Polyangiaceae bacterium]